MILYKDYINLLNDKLPLDLIWIRIYNLNLKVIVQPYIQKYKKLEICPSEHVWQPANIH